MGGLMISQRVIPSYQGVFYERGPNHLYLPPHAMLRPYISNYTVSFPTQNEMPDDYTILPTASCTLVVSVHDGGIISRLRGVNTRACKVGVHANKMKLLLLIEFHPGGLYPFLPVNQQELLDASVSLDLLDNRLKHSVENALEDAGSIQVLVDGLDGIFLSLLAGHERNEAVASVMRHILMRRGEASIRELSEQTHYSPKHMGRLFTLHIGASPKLFSRVVRVNHAIHLLQGRPANITGVAAQAGYFDQPHFIHDFKSICSLTPQEYLKRMSVFYNDRFKI